MNRLYIAVIVREEQVLLGGHNARACIGIYSVSADAQVQELESGREKGYGNICNQDLFLTVCLCGRPGEQDGI